MRQRRSYSTDSLTAALLGILLSSCSVTEYRQLLFSGYQPAPVSKKIPGSVTIETKVIDLRYADANFEEAMRQVIAEDIAALFSEPSFQKGVRGGYLVRVTARYHGGATLVSTATLEVTSTVVNAGTENILFSHTRKGERIGHEPQSLLRRVMPEVREDLIKAFDGAVPLVGQPALLPGIMGDR